jgi:hypothetical protein
LQTEAITGIGSSDVLGSSIVKSKMNIRQSIRLFFVTSDAFERREPRKTQSSKLQINPAN